MNKIRHNVFETNSSSVHSIVITEEKTAPHNSVVFSIDEFGWECAVYDSVDGKARYFYTAACLIYRTDMCDKIRKLLEPFGIECIFNKKPEFKEYGKRNYLENGYIDHGDETKQFVDTLLNDPILFVNYLFNPDSFVVTYNDNMEDEDWDHVKELTDVSYPHMLFVKGN